jgi:uncharacterized protein YdhG (YjbR/CyaY superfamily)
MSTEQYIAEQPTELQPMLLKLTATIRQAAPTATERIAYRMPCFYVDNKYLCGFAVFAKHIGFYPGSEPIGVFAEQLTSYKTSTGAVQFPRGKPIDLRLVTAIINYRLSGQKPAPPANA